MNPRVLTIVIAILAAVVAFRLYSAWQEDAVIRDADPTAQKACALLGLDLLRERGISPDGELGKSFLRDWMRKCLAKDGEH